MKYLQMVAPVNCQATIYLGKSLLIPALLLIMSKV